MTVAVDRVPPAPKPDLEPEPKSNFERVLLAVFVVVPFLALFAAVPMAWGRYIGWTDVIIAAVFYVFAGLGITVGFHRYFTHGSFKTSSRALKIVLGVAGSFALEMGVIDWVATHRRHHKYSDKEGDPHSPWRFGNDWKALTKGLIYAHVGWLFSSERTNRERYARDLLNDRDVKRIHDLFPLLAAASVLLPAVIGGLVTWSISGALTAFFWGTLVRIALLHHVTWSVNSICHVFGNEDFEVRDKSRNVWWLAIPSFGESWHNLHHADPTCARHGALKGQLDPSARVIRWFEQLGLAYDVRWPDPQRLAGKQVNTAKPVRAA